MERIDLDIQWNMAERKIQNEIMDKIKKDSVCQIGLNNIKLIRVENERIFFLGTITGAPYVYEYSALNGNRNKVDFISGSPRWWESKKQKKLEAYTQRYNEFARANLEELRVLVLPLGIYSESLEKVNQRMSTTFRKVDTKTSLSYMVENGEFWLKAKAFSLGADAIVDFSEKEYNLFLKYDSQGGIKTHMQKVSIGVPVKIRNDEP